MGRILDTFLDKKNNQHCNSYPNPETHFNALLREEADAFKCLMAKISGTLFKIGKEYKLTNDDIEELLCDCITTFLLKIKEGKYVFQGFEPTSYVIEIGKNKIKNFQRKISKYGTSDVEDLGEIADESSFGDFEETEKLEKLLAKLDANCQKLIRLKYLEEYRDIYVIEHKLTQYVTVDSLKNQRSKCFKKLVDIGATTLNI